MNISGKTRILCPPDALVAALHDPAVLGALLPGTSTITPEGDGAFALVLSRALGPFTLTLPARLMLSRQGAGHCLTLTAAHALGGKLRAEIQLDIHPHPRASVLAFAGEVSATGILGRYLGEDPSALQTRAFALAQRLKRQVEATTGPVAPSAGSRASSG